ncbi:amino acid ABC transporter permease [Ancylobacter amanitiformis]|uniref:Polar amino acid transport system permease protein n=1 Tax=Ancylobacter amanitiformis TaxID=217069 RepID=A0ABU0LSB9_9HYPH|nr:amino acid ABC transporter permease [Ancylobacter amanitiformis]MDQ0511586.1 polar amino acid transport system permease protein [Ancylobacter amanitiformis]
MTFNLAILTDNWRDLLDGMVLTVLIWAGGTVMGLAIGLMVAVVQLLTNRWIAAPLNVYVAVMRGTPFLIQLFIIYYGGPFFGLDLTPMVAGVAGLALYGGAYFSEIFRAGFVSVPPGQIEAARMMGISRLAIVRHVQLPQMLVIILPALANMTVLLSKETAVLSVITVNELTSVVQSIGSTTFAFAETLLFLALVYWAFLEIVTAAARRLEKRVGRFMLRTQN